MNALNLRLWFLGGLVAVACSLATGTVASGQTPPPDDIIMLTGYLNCSGDNGSRECPVRLHYITLSHERTYCIRMEALEFEPNLMLEDMAGNLLAMNTDDFDTLPGCIVFRPATTGRYRLVAGALPPIHEGMYRITVRELPVLVRIENALMPSDTVHGDCFVRTHDITLIEGRRYIIDMESTAFAPYVKLLDASGAILAFNDEGCSPRPARLVFTAPRTEVYRLAATSASPFATGAFTLTVCEE